MLNKIKKEKKIPEIKGILKHYRITHVLRNPLAPLPAGRQRDELVFHVRFINGSNGKPVKSDEYLTYDAVAGTHAFQEYARQYLTPRLGRAIGVYPGTNVEVVSFAETEAVRQKHEQYMTSVYMDLNRKRKSHTFSMVEPNPRQDSIKKFRHNDSLSIKSEPVIRELNERFATEKRNTYNSDAASVHSQWLGSQSSKSSLITTTSVSTLRSVFEPATWENNNPEAIADKENNPALAVKREKRPAPPPPIAEKDESFSSFASASSGSASFNDSFGADGTPYSGHRPSGPIKKRDSLCCVM
uniref:Doublecortin domain-containing protein n=1 Tax=Panagrellus redivivus TaxID=6233 RepID=A0A7E4W9F5_PANRE